MKLVIIEGPGKRDTLKKYLGNGYDVFATKGHVRDLPTNETAVDISNNFEPKYVIMPDKQNIIKDLKLKAEKAEKILLATDPDREGEAISWHIEKILNINEDEPCRVEFNEISKSVVNNAIANPRKIDMNLVHAQQGRRVLDRLVGYKISPIICKKIIPNLSAGRVQSVALKLVVDKEKDIKNFKPKEYWTISSLLEKSNIKFKANLVSKQNKKYVPTTEEESCNIIKYLRNNNFYVSSIKKSVTKSSPPPPFTTSTMQQDALNKIGLSIAKTTKSAQSLYEGVELGNEGKVALITYIRTDSTRVSPEAQAKAKDFIVKNYGKDYAPERYNQFKTKKNIQDAHEAIRPISLDRTPESIKEYMSSDNYKLYKLIYERFLASQMSSATYDTMVVNINCGDYGFKVSGRAPIFLGFTKAYNVYEEKEDDVEDSNTKLPSLIEGEKLNLLDLTKEQKFTKPPVRFTEASLVKAMEEKGIGRPATYAPTISVLLNRKYMEKQSKYLYPTELGITVTDFLEKYFPDVMNVSFTAEMEDNLDRIAEGKINWQSVVKNFYGNFEKEVNFAYKGSQKVSLPVEETDVICEKCGAKMVIRIGKTGKFLACPNFPRCKNSKSLEEPKKPICLCPDCGGNVIEKRTRLGKIFYGCSNYPKCNFASWVKPTDLKCPICNSYLVVFENKNSLNYKCSNKNCNFTKQENRKEDEEKK